MSETSTDAPAGYTHDSRHLPPSPVSAEELAALHASVLWTEDDAAALRRAGEVLAPQTEAILDVWYGFVAGNPHLVAAFAGADGEPDADYLAAVRKRFGLWITDLCTREHNAQWLAYQEEIALRHTTSKSRTDHVDSPASHVALRDLIALAVPITLTVRPFLEVEGADPAEVEAQHQAWFKAVVLSVALWARPYSPQMW
ncbi:protoglobin domain-containing protein [Ornithinimicrobium cavernae]|uniref:protoglobin domain-containing protein n=1 Tax=Ornithinimicrobium cavernae TaxID=2666047 RepID=UPI000D69FE37|nr:protoglobin domain-containing protein [Ornithinimicrobium cavernae]